MSCSRDYGSSLLSAVFPPKTDSKFPKGSQEYHFFRAALKLLQSNGLVPKDTVQKFVTVVGKAENGMVDFGNVLSGLKGGDAKARYRSALEEISKRLKDNFAYSKEAETYKEEKIYFRHVYQKMSRVVRKIADTRADNTTGHHGVIQEWENLAKYMETMAEKSAELFDEEVATFSTTEEAAGKELAANAVAATETAKTAGETVTLKKVVEILAIILNI